jgi:hypothetical protein
MKNNHRWFDAKVLLAIFSLVASLGLWNIFARSNSTPGQAAGSSNRSQLASSSGSSNGSFFTNQTVQPQSIFQSFLSAPAPMVTTRSSRP